VAEDGFQNARTIADILTDIEHQQLVLPAIQREFVWDDTKICALFDSLMRGYPIGGFLFWRVSNETVRLHPFYGFIKNFDQRPPKNVCPRLGEIAPSDNRYAILDGQQRLTSLNIGLRGSHTVKLPNKWWDNPDAFPERHLYLDLFAAGPSPEDSGADEESGDTERYVFRFRTAAQVDAENQAGHRWTRVADVLPLDGIGGVLAHVAQLGIGDHPRAMETLGRLHEVVHRDRTISPFIEPDQSIDRVMNIFIRVNAQGEPLSFADLLLSQATAAWTSETGGGPVDAREEIRSFNEHLNRPDHRFDFKRDQIMKACLVLTDATSVRFQIENYGTRQMLQIRDAWPDIKRCLDLAAQLLDQFGLTAVNLSAKSVIHPVAYYIKHRGLDASYLTAKGYETDRASVQRWVVRSLLRQGTWGSGLDTLLTRIRTAIKEHGSEGFPTEAIEKAMGAAQKGLTFDEDAVQGLLKVRYTDKTSYPLLSIVYPSGDSSRRHVDHIYPQTLLTKAALKRAGLSDEKVAILVAKAQEVPNLQLLTPPENESKGGKSPGQWLVEAYPDPVERGAVSAFHHLGTVPDDVIELEGFWLARAEKLAAVVRARLGVVEA
jgi:hypothetical protein